ncbi:unnamed protein product [Prunus armeniaca]|uniref:Uncharacterized protein n=1 Tax=Prunus armeniaca TaxID=36596 RepID=A0A6J5TQ54_PRUAR|nr:unnamed protein product [Prunus armeniaca]CAB4295211.1 unnamed protein product [Prunus armeniaca]
MSENYMDGLAMEEDEGLFVNFSLIQTPRAVLFIIQSIKTVVAGGGGPVFQVKKPSSEVHWFNQKKR